MGVGVIVNQGITIEQSERKLLAEFNKRNKLVNERRSPAPLSDSATDRQQITALKVRLLFCFVVFVIFVPYEQYSSQSSIFLLRYSL